LLVLRLARTGRRNQPKYRLVVAEHDKPVDGKVVAVLGHYDPTDKNKPLVIEKEAISAWLGKGAKPSNAVAKLLNRREGFDLPVHIRPERAARKAAKEEPVKPVSGSAGQSETESVSEETKAETAPVEEAPVEEAPAEAGSEMAAAEAPIEAAAAENTPEVAEAAPAEDNKPAE
jgi:small subunit ribosomal protein S16